MSSRTILDELNNPDNFNFDDTEIQVTTEAKLIAQVSGAEAYMYVKLDDNQGVVAIDSSGNNRHGAFQGGYTENQWVPGKINTGVQGISTTSGLINFNQQIIFERTNSFSLECWVKTTSSATMSLMSKKGNDLPFEGFALNILSGKVRGVVRDISNNVLSIENNTAINDGIWHHVVFTYDGSSLITGIHVYVDNAENDNIIASIPLTATILNSVNFQVSGREGNNNCIDSNTVVDECVVYDRELSAAEVSFRYNSGAGTQQLPGATTTFPTDRPPVKPKIGIEAISVESFTADITASGGDAVLFRFIINNVPTYWDGAAWSQSNNNTQVNTIAEIQANLATLLTGDLAGLNWEAFLVSADGSTTPILRSVTAVINIGAGDVEKELVRVTFDSHRGDCNPSFRTIKAIPIPDVVKYKGKIMIRDDELPIIINEGTGEGEIRLVETDNMEDPTGQISQPYYKFVFSPVKKLNRVVNSGSPEVNFFDLVAP